MATPGTTAVTVVTQTQVQPGKEDAFAAWQTRIGNTVAGFPGFAGQTVIRPSPPTQVDWVVLQKFANSDSALAWLRSDQRQKMVREVRPILVGLDDVHLVHDRGESVAAPPVSAVIATKVKPGCEKAYEAWEHRIADAQAVAPGFKGYRFERPVPGEQDDYVAILQFDTEAHLQGWLDSPARRKLVEEADPLTVEYHARIARTGFDQWFTVGAAPGAPPPAAWKQNMLVIAVLYPMSFAFTIWVQGPLLMSWAGLPFWLAFFIGITVGVLLLSKVLPPVSRLFDWWLSPAGRDPWKTNLAGAAVMVVLYLVALLAYWQIWTHK